MTYEEHLQHGQHALDLTGTIHHSTVYGNIVIVSYYNGVNSEISPEVGNYLAETGRQISSHVIIGDSIFDKHSACNMKVKLEDGSFVDEPLTSIVYIKRGEPVPSKAWFYRALCAHYYKFEWSTNIFTELSSEMAKKPAPEVPVYDPEPMMGCDGICEACQSQGMCDAPDMEEIPDTNTEEEVTE